MTQTFLAKSSIAVAFFAILVFGRQYFKQQAIVSVPTAAVPKTAAVDIVSMQQSYAITRQFSGRLVASTVSELGFPIGGAIIGLQVTDGAQVKRGDIIATLDSRQTQTERDQLLAYKEEVKASLVEAEILFKRLEPLVPGAATPQRLDELRGQRDRARANLKRIDARIASLSAREEDLVLRAAFDGQVVQRFVEIGSVVTAGQPIVRVNGGRGLEARIGVPATLRNEFRIGQTFSLKNADLAGTGALISIVDNITASTQTITLVLAIQDDPGFTPAGLVELDVKLLKPGTGTWVDAGSLTESIKGLWSVYTVKLDGQPLGVDEFYGTIARNDVEILHMEADKAYVSGTLYDGAFVVRSSPFRFVPGQSVRIAAPSK